MLWYHLTFFFHSIGAIQPFQAGCGQNGGFWADLW
jgi:hypothetical protein